MNVLLIEDDRVDATLAMHHLAQCETHQFQVCHAWSLVAAREAIDSDVPFDVILLDLNLPGSSGSETVRRCHDLAPSIPIVAYTGQMVPDLDALVLAGADDLLDKHEMNGNLPRTVVIASKRRQRPPSDALQREFEAALFP